MFHYAKLLNLVINSALIYKILTLSLTIFVRIGMFLHQIYPHNSSLPFPLFNNKKTPVKDE
ncbi:hypothetical protein LPBF_11970 [Flavobacterium crassostreae]|uniref:Uncharacterized protein n=1 Tax=Flavobacterium crassostreae TaxID=1763534 RepID=A0A1B9DMQ7_9FLAO|nr:hypothetical protein LPBF_11970 [Flavobacterium crassostreae]